MSERYKFYNPYNFIPLRAPNYSKERKDSYTYSNIKKGDSHVRHDRWQAGTKSGRIICSLTLETPTFVGAERTEGDKKKKTPATATHYRNHEGLAIPANSLRGMITPIAEALSSSAFRVLANEHYSVRATTKEALSAIGMVKKDKDGTFIYPLTLPSFSEVGYGEKKRLWESILKKVSVLDFLPVLLDLDRAKPSGKSDEGLRPEQKNYAILRGAKSYHGDEGQNYSFGMRLYKNSGDSGRFLPDDFEDLYNANWSRIPSARKARAVIGQEPLSKDLKIKGELGKEDTPGVLLILDDDNSKNTPKEKKHELFIPMPNGKFKVSESVKVPVSEKVLSIYSDIAVNRVKNGNNDEVRIFPLLPKGYKHPASAAQDKIKRYIKDGDLVYFDIERAEEGIRVKEVSYSAIWRKNIADETYDFVGKVSEDLLPWNPKRKTLTAAEAIFGVVQQEASTKARNLASRVRFSDAIGQDIKQLNKPIRLKPLGSPKAPSPSMYFLDTKNPSQYIKKSDLSSNRHKIRGRKYYLPHNPKLFEKMHKMGDEWPNSKKPKNAHLYTDVNALLPGQELYFSIDFNNLDSAELDLLLASIYPDESFLHRIGAGKPLGLGCVKLRPQAICINNRDDRYSASGLESKRYEHVWCSGKMNLSGWFKEKYSSDYPQELFEGGGSAWDLNHSLIEANVLASLVMIGSLESQEGNVGVEYPYVIKNGAKDDKAFSWFVENERGKNSSHQSMPSADRTIDSNGIDWSLEGGRTNVEGKIKPLETIVVAGKSKESSPTELSGNNSVGAKNRGGSDSTNLSASLIIRLYREGFYKDKKDIKEIKEVVCAEIKKVCDKDFKLSVHNNIVYINQYAKDHKELQERLDGNVISIMGHECVFEKSRIKRK